MAPKRGSGLLEWSKVGYTDNITALYVSDDEYVGSIDELEEDIKLARQLVTVHRVTADRMLLRAQRLENDRSMMRVNEKFKEQTYSSRRSRSKRAQSVKKQASQRQKIRYRHELNENS